ALRSCASFSNGACFRAPDLEAQREGAGNECNLARAIHEPPAGSAIRPGGHPHFRQAGAAAAGGSRVARLVFRDRSHVRDRAETSWPRARRGHARLGGTVSGLVLVIEDEKEIRDLVRYNLEHAGFKVAAFADGDQGLERLFASRPDALVLDLMLPGKNGLEILREVRSEPATRDLPVIVLTARAAEMDKLLGFEHGADDYL